jgi:hypothetical protein
MGSFGHAAELRRFPVKSFAGERLSDVEITSYGVYGDRSHVYYDPAKTGFAHFLTARQLPAMLTFRAELGSREEAAPGEFPPLRVTAPDGTTYGWEPALHNCIQELAGIPLEAHRHQPEEPNVLAVDDSPVLLVTDASLRAVEAQWGRRLDPLRFRANIVVALEAETPFIERGWLGRTIRLGEQVELRAESLCQRCRMVGLDPETTDNDPSLLKLLAGGQDACFGVYCSVVRTGRLVEGDNVTIE